MIPEPRTRSDLARERLRWALADPGLAALGCAHSDELFEPMPDPARRRELLERAPGCVRLRLALPGTPDARGNLVGRPGPLGTGWLWLSAYDGGLLALLRARCTTPPSASRAEREWNLLCHLRAEGVATPEPLVVGARGAGLVSRRSFLVVRAPEDAEPLPRWLVTQGVGAERARGLEALGLFVARLARARVALAAPRAEHLWLTSSAAGGCEAHELPGLRANRLPSVCLVEVRGARLERAPSARTRAALLAALAPSLAPEELARVAAHAAEPC